MGIAEKVVDALMFSIFTKDTEQLIARRIIRTTQDPKTVNERLDQLHPTIKEPNKTIVVMKRLLPNITLPSIGPEPLIGYEFTVDYVGNLHAEG